MLFEDEEINSAMKAELENFFKTSENGKVANFIIRQRENPDPSAVRITQKELTDEEALEVLQSTMQGVWGP